MLAAKRTYVLTEYGSWSVLLISYAIGLGVSRAFPWQAAPLLAALALLINSKAAFLSWMRSKGDRRATGLFLAQAAVGGFILLALFREGILQLLPLVVFPAAYLLSTRFAGEHALATELFGFCLLSLAAVLTKFLVVQGVDVRLFAAVALYFGAGVFKIKFFLLRKTRYRILMLLYILLAVFIYRRFYIQLLILLPLAENLAAVAMPYKVRLRTTGWIEVVKSLVFLGLMLRFF